MVFFLQNKSTRCVALWFIYIVFYSHAISMNVIPKQQVGFHLTVIPSLKLKIANIYNFQINLQWWRERGWVEEKTTTTHDNWNSQCLHVYFLDNDIAKGSQRKFNEAVVIECRCCCVSLSRSRWLLLQKNNFNVVYFCLCVWFQKNCSNTALEMKFHLVFMELIIISFYHKLLDDNFSKIEIYEHIISPDFHRLFIYSFRHTGILQI